MRFLCSALVFSFFLSGCLATFPIPGEKEGQAKYLFDGDDIEVLGPVSIEGEVVVLLGYFYFGPDNFGYVKLMQKARMTLGADTVIDVVVDRHVTGVLGMFFGRMEWRASGIAIRYRDRLRAKPAEELAKSAVTATPTATTAPAAAPSQRAAGIAQPAGTSAPAAAGEGSRETRETSGFSFGLRAAYAWPSGSLGDGELRDYVDGQPVPGWVDVGYRFSESHYAGLYGSIGLPSRTCDEVWVESQVMTEVEDCSAQGFRVGAMYAYRFGVGASLAPWIGVGAGYEGLRVEQKHVHTVLAEGLNLPAETSRAYGTLSGMEVNFQAGLDFITAGTFGIGPFAAVSAGQYLTSNVPMPDGVDLTGGGLHTWIFAGVRIVNR